MKTISIQCPNEAATRSVGEKLALQACAPLRIYFSGPLGAGKSSLIRAFLRALGVQGAIKSPSYALVEPYVLSNFSVYHFDFYRFFDQNEWVDSGFRDYFEEHAICLVEWPEKAADFLPPADLLFTLGYANSATQEDDVSQARTIRVQAFSGLGETILQQLTE